MDSNRPMNPAAGTPGTSPGNAPVQSGGAATVSAPAIGPSTAGAAPMRPAAPQGAPAAQMNPPAPPAQPRQMAPGIIMPPAAPPAAAPGAPQVPSKIQHKQANFGPAIGSAPPSSAGMSQTAAMEEALRPMNRLPDEGRPLPVAEGMVLTGAPGKITTFGKEKRHEDSWSRSPNTTGAGAIHVKTFHCKLTEDALMYMDQTINEWLDAHPQYEVKFVGSSIGIMTGKLKEPALICQIWV